MEKILGTLLPPPTSLQGDPLKIKSSSFIFAGNAPVGFPFCLESALKVPGHTVFLHKLPRTLSSPPSVPGHLSQSASPCGLPAFPPARSPPAHSGLRWPSLPRGPASGVQCSPRESSGQRPLLGKPPPHCVCVYWARYPRLFRNNLNVHCGRMDEDSEVWTCEGASFSFEKEGNPATWDNSVKRAGYRRTGAV